MAFNEIKGDLVDIKIWSKIEETESGVFDQLRNVAKLPWVFHHVASMADAHVGKGCTVGAVIAMRDAVSPAAVGVDIGCGMGVVKTNLKASDLPDDLGKIRAQVERDIPVGFNAHNKIIKSTNINLQNQIDSLMSRFKTLVPYVHNLDTKAAHQLGTLGGGNHFIELCLDTNDDVYLMLHSGSRNIGKEVSEIHIKHAHGLDHNQLIVDRDLAVFLANTPEMAQYRNDLYFAQEYAMLNRKLMMELYTSALKRFFPQLTTSDEVWCHHNYVAEEIHFGEKVFVTRKGAINAEAGKLGLIPGSMGAKSFIVRGLGSADSFNSASHGAGRKMSRGQAKRTFTLNDLKEQTKGIECRKDSGVIDEIPGAYKDILQVMENQKDLVEIVTELHQVMCIKG